MPRLAFTNAHTCFVGAGWSPKSLNQINFQQKKKKLRKRRKKDMRATRRMVVVAQVFILPECATVFKFVCAVFATQLKAQLANIHYKH